MFVVIVEGVVSRGFWLWRTILAVAGMCGLASLLLFSVSTASAAGYSGDLPSAATASGVIDALTQFPDAAVTVDPEDPAVIQLEVTVPERVISPSAEPSPVPSKPIIGDPSPGPSNDGLPRTGGDFSYLWIIAAVGIAVAIVGAVFWSKSRRRT